MRRIAHTLALLALLATAMAEESGPESESGEQSSELRTRDAPMAGIDTRQIPEYRLFPGDLLIVQVYDHPDLTVQIRVPASGRVNFPLIGTVEDLVDRTIDDLTAELTERLERDYIRQAIITTTVVEFGPRRAYVMGSVASPGYVDLNPVSSLTAMQAIGQAGGFSDDANRAAVRVLRQESEHEDRKLPIPVPAAADEQVLSGDPRLRAGDLVIVPQLDRVYIIGQVRQAGAINLPSDRDLSVSKAISLAGGFDKFAKQGEVQLIRSVGGIEVVDVQAILRGAEDEEPVLQPGDTIYVPESRF